MQVQKNSCFAFIIHIKYPQPKPTQQLQDVDYFLLVSTELKEGLASTFAQF